MVDGGEEWAEGKARAKCGEEGGWGVETVRCGEERQMSDRGRERELREMVVVRNNPKDEADEGEQTTGPMKF